MYSTHPIVLSLSVLYLESCHPYWMTTSIGLWLFDGLILHVYDTDIPLCVLL